MAIYLVNLLCPSEHPVTGMPIEYANPDPPRAWCETVENEFKGEILTQGPQPCPTCGARFDPASWKIEICSTRFQTIDEAHATLSRLCELPN